MAAGWERLERLRKRPDHVVVGLSSGTSADGIDAVCVRLWDEGEPPAVRFDGLIHDSFPYGRELQRRILDAAAAPATEIASLHVEIGERFAEAALEIARRAGGIDRVALAGSHGQTVFHRPPSPAGRGATLQIGCPHTIAERTGLPVVADFRSRDVAAGGHGAPLVPRAERLLFARPERPRAFLNLGGVANVTLLGGPGDDPIACDLGPANCLPDALVRIASGGESAFDSGGERAAAGRPVSELIEAALADPFFASDPPKSLDRDTFGARLARAWLAQGRPLEDLLATAVEFAARAAALGIERLCAENPPLRPREIYVSGGGARNPVLRAAVERAVGLPLLDVEELGVPGEAKEALAFAVLARESLLGRPGNEPRATGAARRVVLGSLVP